MKTFKTFMNEMATIVSNLYNELDDEDGKVRKNLYEKSKNNYVEKTMPNNITLHHNMEIKGGRVYTNYHTNDNNKKETIHYATIIKKNKSKDLPFDHEEQIEVRKQSNNSNLPKGHATDVIYNHFKNGELPLKSSLSQTQQGHKMWERLAHRAMDEGHHVYHHNGTELIKSTPKTIDNHLKSSFGDDVEYSHKHMIISKKEL
ncbi:MAG: hypothetical protein PHG08_00265 [Bacilli bacterium]|nr:hypothetical protein [Bacilli bacterium]